MDSIRPFVANIINGMQNNNNSLDKHIRECREVCSTSYNDLTEQHMDTIDQLVTIAPGLIVQLKEQAQTAMNAIKSGDVSDVIQTIQKVTIFLKKPATKTTLQQMVDKYGDLAEEHVDAICAYLRCLVRKIDPHHKAIAVAVSDVVLAAVALMGNDKVNRFTERFSESFRTAAKPLLNDVVVEGRRQIPNNATNNSRTNSGNATKPTNSRGNAATSASLRNNSGSSGTNANANAHATATTSAAPPLRNNSSTANTNAVPALPLKNNSKAFMYNIDSDAVLTSSGGGSGSGKSYRVQASRSPSKRNTSGSRRSRSSGGGSKGQQQQHQRGSRSRASLSPPK